MMKIGFAGTPALAADILAHLLTMANVTVTHVYTQPDKPTGRGRKIQLNPVKKLALQHNLPLLQPSSLRDPASLVLAHKYPCDLIIVVAYGLLIPPELLAWPKLGCLNLHFSLLPKWRGAAPMQYALLHGDTETGVSLMKMDKGLDTGPVYAMKSCPLTEADTGLTLPAKLCHLAKMLLTEYLPDIYQQTCSPHPQDHHLATLAPKINKADSLLKWPASAIQLVQQIRAFVPWPIAYSYLEHIPVKILAAHVVNTEQTSAPPGTILKKCRHQGIWVQTGHGVLAITQLQLPGKKPMAVKDYLNGDVLFAQHTVFVS